MDSPDSRLKPRDSGPLATPPADAKAAYCAREKFTMEDGDSRLIQMIRYKLKDQEMPPDAQLKPAEISALEDQKLFSPAHCLHESRVTRQNCEGDKDRPRRKVIDVTPKIRNRPRRLLVIAVSYFVTQFPR